MSGESILIVEDEYVTQVAITQTLRTMGYIVAGTVLTGEEAYEQSLELKPDLVLMDITLEGKMDGIEAAKKIIDTLKIPVIYVSAHTSQQIFKRASHTQFSDFVIKPFADRELGDSIKQALERSKQRRI